MPTKQRHLTDYCVEENKKDERLQSCHLFHGSAMHSPLGCSPLSETVSLLFALAAITTEYDDGQEREEVARPPQARIITISVAFDYAVPTG